MSNEEHHGQHPAGQCDTCYLHWCEVEDSEIDAVVWPCHCGEPIIWHQYDERPPWTRRLCEHCDSVRCDALPGECGRRDAA